MNERLKFVFSEEGTFTQANMAEAHERFQDIMVQKQDVSRLLGILDIRKAMGPNGVSGRPQRECKDQLIQPIWEVITSSIEEGKVQQEWKRANMVPLY